MQVIFDSGRMNTLSSAAITELGEVVAEIEAVSKDRELVGVLLTGNSYGLGAGADIGELMTATKAELAGFVDRGHQVLNAIASSSVPWLAVVDGVCLGGIYELALACAGILATGRSTFGFPEINLNIFPGLGGTQRMPRRSGLVNAEDPVKGDAGFTAVLTGKMFKAEAAAKIRMIDVVVPDGEDIVQFATKYFVYVVEKMDQPGPADLANAEAQKPMVLPMVKKATMGRPNPRAPYVALDVMCAGAGLPLDQALRLERDAFLEVATSAEGRAGMRFFFAKQLAEKLPKDLPKPEAVYAVGIAGIDGLMGNAIAFLALEARKRVVGFVPQAALDAMGLTLDDAVKVVRAKLRAKYEPLRKRGKCTEDEVETAISKPLITTDITALRTCDLVIEALAERRGVKEAFMRELAQVGFSGIVASNSSSMGPAILAGAFVKDGGDASKLLGLHFFSPAEHPSRLLVEVVVGKETSAQSMATAHGFVRAIGKTPLIVQDGSTGFVVNAGLAAYMLAAEQLYLEGTPIPEIDAAMRATVFPMGPFQLADFAGVDVAAGMFDEMIAAGDHHGLAPLVCTLRNTGNLGVKTGIGYYVYQDGKPVDLNSGLAGFVCGERVATQEEIVERCCRALYDKARELVARDIVRSAEECDLGFVLGIGFAMHLGGPLFYGQQHGWGE
ncbi:MAG: 3-hydroxyacyl-CoA dehydrogenase NAD-binding domain-containing protein [Patescibacteria group bacterium]